MRKFIVILLGLVSILPSLSFAGPLDLFVGSYTLDQGTVGIDVNGDLICPNPLIFSLSLSALDSNMPQLPLLQVETLQSGNTRYTGQISSDGDTFNYKQVTKSSCFLGFFCDTDDLDGSLNLSSTTLTLIHSEVSSSDGTSSSGTCIYNRQN